MLINLASQYAPWLPDRLFADGQQGLWYVTQPVYRGEQVLFQDAAGTTPVVADGDPVGLMLDLSPNGNHATQSTSAARPLYRTDGTLHWLEFDGVDDLLVIGPGLDIATQAFSVSVAHSTATSSSTYVTALGDGSGAGTLWGMTSEYAVRVSSGRVIFDQAAGAGVKEIFTTTFTGGDLVSGINAYLDNSPLGVDSSIAQTIDIAPGGVLCARQGDVGFSDSDIYGLVVSNGEVWAAPTRDRVENYLAELQGRTL